MQAQEFATVAEYNARIEELAQKREQASGSAKGQLTKVIRALETSRDELYAKQCREEVEQNPANPVEPQAEQPESESTPDEPVDVDQAVAEFHEAQQKLIAQLREQGAGEIAAIIEAGEKVKLTELEEAVAQVLNRVWNSGGLEGGVGEADVAAIGDYVVQSGLLAYYSAAKFGNGEWASKAVVKRVSKRFDELHAQPETETQPEGEPVAA